MYDEEFYEMDDNDYEYLESLNEDLEYEYKIKEHILENKQLMRYIQQLDSMNVGEENGL